MIGLDLLLMATKQSPGLNVMKKELINKLLCQISLVEFPEGVDYMLLKCVVKYFHVQ